jgi:hypothetical protein
VPFTLEKVHWKRVEESASGLSQAEMTRAAEDAACDAVPSNDAVIDMDIILRALGERLGEISE